MMAVYFINIKFAYESNISHIKFNFISHAQKLYNRYLQKEWSILHVTKQITTHENKTEKKKSIDTNSFCFYWEENFKKSRYKLQYRNFSMLLMSEWQPHFTNN